MIYVVMLDGMYMVKTPYWNAGAWTHDINQAEVFDDEDEFFAENYPAFKLVEVDEKMLKAYQKREKLKRKERRERKKERLEELKKLGIK